MVKKIYIFSAVSRRISYLKLIGPNLGLGRRLGPLPYLVSLLQERLWLQYTLVSRFESTKTGQNLLDEH